MSEILIARFKNKKEAVLVEQLIGTMRTAKVLQKGNNLEDMYFAELINEGMKEKGSTPIKLFKKQLDAKIKVLQK
jgi:hypothetical protein